jgi:hypothetical protein
MHLPKKGGAHQTRDGSNSTGDAVTFWEYDITNQSNSRIVIANLKYTTSVGPMGTEDNSTPDPTEAGFAALGTYVISPPPVPGIGTYTGVGGGTAVVSDAPGAAGHTIRTVTYTDYVNEDGMVLNGFESSDNTASQASVHYVAVINVSGAHTGYLKADANINQLQRTMTGYVTSDVDGDVLNLLDPARRNEDLQNT